MHDGVQLKTLSGQHCVGSVGFVDEPISATSIKALNKTLMYKLTRKDFERIMHQVNSYFDKIPLLTIMKEKDRVEVAKHAVIVTYPKDACITMPGKSATHFFIVLTGTVAMNGKFYESTHYFGHESLLEPGGSQSTNYRHKAIATKFTTLWSLRADQFLQESFANVRAVIESVSFELSAPSMSTREGGFRKSPKGQGHGQGSGSTQGTTTGAVGGERNSTKAIGSKASRPVSNGTMAMVKVEQSEIPVIGSSAQFDPLGFFTSDVKDSLQLQHQRQQQKQQQSPTISTQFDPLGLFSSESRPPANVPPPTDAHVHAHAQQGSPPQLPSSSLQSSASTHIQQAAGAGVGTRISPAPQTSTSFSLGVGFDPLGILASADPPPAPFTAAGPPLAPPSLAGGSSQRSTKATTDAPAAPTQDTTTFSLGHLLVDNSLIFGSTTTTTPSPTPTPSPPTATAPPIPTRRTQAAHANSPAPAPTAHSDWGAVLLDPSQWFAFPGNGGGVDASHAGGAAGQVHITKHNGGDNFTISPTNALQTGKKRAGTKKKKKDAGTEPPSDESAAPPPQPQPQPLAERTGLNVEMGKVYPRKDKGESDIFSFWI